MGREEKTQPVWLRADEFFHSILKKKTELICFNELIKTGMCLICGKLRLKWIQRRRRWKGRERERERERGREINEPIKLKGYAEAAQKKRLSAFERRRKGGGWGGRVGGRFTCSPVPPPLLKEEFLALPYKLEAAVHSTWSLLRSPSKPLHCRSSPASKFHQLDWKLRNFTSFQWLWLWQWISLVSWRVTCPYW